MSTILSVFVEGQAISDYINNYSRLQLGWFLIVDLIDPFDWEGKHLIIKRFLSTLLESSQDKGANIAERYVEIEITA